MKIWNIIFVLFIIGCIVYAFNYIKDTNNHNEVLVGAICLIFIAYFVGYFTGSKHAKNRMLLKEQKMLKRQMRDEETRNRATRGHVRRRR